MNGYLQTFHKRQAIERLNESQSIKVEKSLERQARLEHLVNCSCNNDLSVYM